MINNHKNVDELQLHPIDGPQDLAIHDHQPFISPNTNPQNEFYSTSIDSHYHSALNEFQSPQNTFHHIFSSESGKNPYIGEEESEFLKLFRS